MSYMRFDHPYFLFAFAIFIFLILFDFFSPMNKYRKNLPPYLAKKLKISVYLFRLSVAFAIIAACGPRWGIEFTAWEYRRGLDAVFAIDVSRSMDIRDAKYGSVQSRLERGLSIAAESANTVTGARFAAAIGRGRGFLAVPLTWDSEAALSFLAAIDGDSITGRSTNLEALIEAAASAFQNTSAAQKVIILVSDGESHAGVTRNAVNLCIREGIIINAIALGSDEGRSVPVEALPSETDQEAQARQNIPVSRRDAAIMRTAAERTGGIYIDGSRDDASSALSSHLLSIAQDTEPGRSRSEPKERRTLFIILALLFYGASKIAPLSQRPLSGKQSWQILSSSSILIFTLIFSALFFSSCSEGKMLLMEANYLNSRGRYDEAVVPYMKALEHEDAAAYAEYGLGLTFYSINEGKAALKRFEASQKKLEKFSAAEHRELRYRNNYNSGVVYFEEGDFQGAAAAFKEALKADPRRIEAKHNLELSLISISKEIENDNSREKQQENETREVLFDYIRQNEQQRWKSREWAPEEKFTGPDY